MSLAGLTLMGHACSQRLHEMQYQISGEWTNSSMRPSATILTMLRGCNLSVARFTGQSERHDPQV
jgi:hypothetical protein